MAAMRTYSIVGALLGWFALVLQLYLMFDSAPGGRSRVGVVIAFFSFFTILTNLLVVLVLTSIAIGHSGFFTNTSMQAAIASYIAIVGVVYELLLRRTWNPQGAQRLADVLLHTVMPIGYVLFWLLFAPRTGLRWKTTISWLIYPAVYLVFTLARGAVSGVYPYPFVDANVLGYGRVLLNAAGFVGVFWGTGLLTIALARRVRNPAAA